MKIASAQIECITGDIKNNLEKHYKFIDIAHKNNVDLIIFPELSITGYCREEAEELSFLLNDTRLDNLKKLAISKNITIVAGLPLIYKSKKHIASLILKPDANIEIYTKQHLHDGEDDFYTSSTINNPKILINQQQISFAICADIEHENHAKNAKNTNSSFYLPSIFYSKSGIDSGLDKLKSYAKSNSLHIVMSNYCGTNWNIEAGGKSCYINDKGEMIAQLTQNQEGLVMVNLTDKEIKTETIAF